MVFEENLATVIVPNLNGGENVVRLVRGALEQTYAPLEVIVVDGGSRDGSPEALERLRSQPKRLRILNEETFGSLKGPANARNLGVLHSGGRYLFFFDADFELSDPDLISKVREQLKKYPWVGARVNPRIDTWLEFHTAVDDYRRDLGHNMHMYFGFAREVFEKVMFDPRLGFGDDWDLKKRLKRDMNLEPVYIDACCERHFIHTFHQWGRQAVWYGRTHVRFMRKWKGFGTRVLAYRTGALVSLLVSVTTALLSPLLSAAFFALFVARVVGAYSYSPTRSKYRMLYLFLRETFCGALFLSGFIVGLLQHLAHLQNCRKP